MGIIVDTNFFIDVERKRLNIEHLDQFANYGDTFIAAVTISELLVGVHLAPNIETRILRSSFVENIIQNIPALEFDENVARSYAELYAYCLKPKGANVHDLQIAATALAHGFYVMTSNKDDFKKIPGVKVICP